MPSGRRAVVPSIDSAPLSFATLVGPSPTTRPGGGAPSTRGADLLAIVVHELRNPLASLRLSLDMAIDELPNVDAEATADLLERARRSACWLQTLTENLSSATCLETGTFDIRPETIDVLECVESATALVKALLEQRRQTVRITCSAPSTSASADPARVTQIVANLLTNASRYSVEGDEIEVHLSTVGPKLRVRVTDHGPGISPEAQQRIFERWVRGEDAARGGLGLGLNIVRRLVEEQGGRVGVDSTLGQGATFWFTLQAP